MKRRDFLKGFLALGTAPFILGNVLSEEKTAAEAYNALFGYRDKLGETCFPAQFDCEKIAADFDGDVAASQHFWEKKTPPGPRSKWMNDLIAQRRSAKSHHLANGTMCDFDSAGRPIFRRVHIRRHLQI